MVIDFYKYQGAGNDFIVIDNRSNSFDTSDLEQIKHLCHRRFGIGSDGIIFLESSNTADFAMNFFNPDGSKSFCGNGSRCIVAFAKFIGIDQLNFTFEAIDGKHEAILNKETVMIKMQDVEKVSKLENASYADTGSPHYMKFVLEVDRVNVLEEGKKIRYSETYKAKGVNVNFIQVIGENELKVRTYERGVENETFACGTGATACALAYLSNSTNGKHLVKVNVKGGELFIHARKTGNKYTEIWLEGPAIQVFKGSINA